MQRVDLAVIGAGLSGCSLLARLEQRGFEGSIALVEAGRGPGGRCATRRRRNDLTWRLDHGAPNVNLVGPLSSGLVALLAPLRQSGCLREDWQAMVGLDHHGAVVSCPDEDRLTGSLLRGHPEMASLCHGLLDLADQPLIAEYQRCVRWLERQDNQWILADQNRQWTLQAKALVLSGNLLAHPRSLKMLGWRGVPLREAIPTGEDPLLDQVLANLATGQAEIRWNLMLELPAKTIDGLPRQIWLTPRAQQRWGVERLVLQQQQDGRIGLVVHGLDQGVPITPDSQSTLQQNHEQRLLAVLQDLAVGLPVLQPLLEDAVSRGVMRWGASRPLNCPLPKALQWCDVSEIGFCGDWIEGLGFGRAQGALESGVALAERLTANL